MRGCQLSGTRGVTPDVPSSAEKSRVPDSSAKGVQLGRVTQNRPSLVEFSRAGRTTARRPLSQGQTEQADKIKHFRPRFYVVGSQPYPWVIRDTDSLAWTL